MPDFLTPAERSRRMSLIRSKDTKPEKAMAKILSSARIRYKRNVRDLPGTPDFVIPGKNLVVFVEGKFWHGQGVDQMSLRPFWRNHASNNMKRDKRVERKLRRMGWSVYRFWEKDVSKRPEWCLKRIKRKS